MWVRVRMRVSVYYNGKYPFFRSSTVFFLSILIMLIFLPFYQQRESEIDQIVLKKNENSMNECIRCDWKRKIDKDKWLNNAEKLNM